MWSSEPVSRHLHELKCFLMHVAAKAGGENAQSFSDEMPGCHCTGKMPGAARRAPPAVPDAAARPELLQGQQECRRQVRQLPALLDIAVHPASLQGQWKTADRWECCWLWPAACLDYKSMHARGAFFQLYLNACRAELARLLSLLAAAVAEADAHAAIPYISAWHKQLKL